MGVRRPSQGSLVGLGLGGLSKKEKKEKELTDGDNSVETVEGRWAGGSESIYRGDKW